MCCCAANAPNFAHFSDCSKWPDVPSFDVAVVKLHRSGTHFTTGNLSHTRATTTTTTIGNFFKSAFSACSHRIKRENHRHANINFFVVFVSHVFFCSVHGAKQIHLRISFARDFSCIRFRSLAHTRLSCSLYRAVYHFRATFRIVLKPFSILIRSLNSF